MQIYVDADACPVRSEIVRVANRYQIAVFFVANRKVPLVAGDRIHWIVVGNGRNAADNWIVEGIGTGDLVITMDIRLAAHCIRTRARVLTVDARTFDHRNIASELVLSKIEKALRLAGMGKSAGEKVRAENRALFEAALETLMQTWEQGSGS